ncbi:MAG: ABC transporter permease [Bacteroidales bacterium]|nr:ABC transporter permease [Bacteroidales bacterium]MBQ7489620.1 ABC transporter permease [Bacteroidales bacterium]
MKELLMILRKEFIHLIRDKITLFLVLALPVMLVLLFGFTISTEIRNARIAVLDQSKDSKSKLLIEKITASGYFQLASIVSSETQIDHEFKTNGIKLAVIIPTGFEEQLTHDRHATLQIINDVSDLNVASILNNYMLTVLNDFSEEYNSANPSPIPFTISTKMEYNPELDSVYMFVPGIITLIMIIVTALMSSITIAREKETGTMRMLLITPVKKIYVIIGKIIPYMLLSFICTILILVISVLVFNMPINGSLAFLLFLCFIFMLTAASFGLMISSLVATQIDAMMVTMMGLFLPTVLLSGFLFPLDNMPYFFQIMADIFPAKWFIIAIKDVMIKGSGFEDIWRYMLILFVMAVVLITISLAKLDKRS